MSTFLALLVVVGILFKQSTCSPLDHKDVDGNRIWKLGKCQTRPTTMRYFNFEYGLKHLVVELMEGKGFNQAVFFRSDVNECNHLFAVPLPFPAKDITCTKTTCVLLRDFVDSDYSPGLSNMYTRNIHVLIGGFIYWLEFRKKQREECSGLVGTPFNYTDPYSLSIFTASSSNDELCQVFAQQINDLQNYMDMSEDYLLEIGMTTFKSFYDMFLTMKQGFSTQQQVAGWWQWSKKSDTAEKFFSFGEAVIQGRIAAITAKDEIAYIKSLFPLQYDLSGLFGTSVTSFRTNMVANIDAKNLIMITREQKLAYIQVNQQPITIGPAYGLFRLYQLNGTVYAIGNDRTIYYSDTIIPYVLRDHGFCQPGFTYFRGYGCKSMFRFHDDFYVPNKICTDSGSAVYNNWFPATIWSSYSRFNGTHSYLVVPWKATYQDALSYCQISGAELVTITSKQKLIEVNNLLKDMITESPNNYSIPGTSDFIFWIKKYDDISGCCDIPQSDVTECDQDADRVLFHQMMGCCRRSSWPTYMPKDPEECYPNFEFLMRETIHGEGGEHVEYHQRLVNTVCVAVVYNPTLGIEFSHKTVPCDKEYNFICQKDPQFYSLPEHQVVDPDDLPISVHCMNDAEVTYSVPFGCSEDVVCILPSGVMGIGGATISRMNYNWKMNESTSMGLPSVGPEISRTCKPSRKTFKKDDCAKRLSTERQKCHHWHEYIKKQECLAHGCCWDDFAFSSINCFERRDTGYIDGPLLPRGRTIKKTLCLASLKMACDYLKCAANAHCEDDPIHFHEKHVCTCDEGYTGNGFLLCIPLTSCPPGFTMISRTGTCVQVSEGDEYLSPLQKHSDYYYSTMRCHRRGASLLSDRTLLKLNTINELSVPLGVTDNDRHYYYHARTNYTHPNLSPACISGFQCNSSPSPFDTSIMYHICNAVQFNQHPIYQSPCWHVKNALCEMPGGPMYVYIHLTSRLMDEETFGFIRILPIPGTVLTEHVSKEEHACALLQTYDYTKTSVYATRVCNNYEDTAVKADLNRFFDAEVPKSTYFAIVAHPFYKYTADVIGERLDGMGILPPIDKTLSLKKTVKTVSGVFYEEQEDESIAICWSTKNIFNNGVKYIGSLIHKVNGTWRCSVYFDGEPDEGVEMGVAVFENGIHALRRVIEAVEPSNTATSHRLNCPHQTFNKEILHVHMHVTDLGNQVSHTGVCKQQPCVMQLICHVYVAATVGEYHNSDPWWGFHVFCRRFHNDVVRCPIARRISMTDNYVEDEVKLPRTNDLPTYLNMDDLLNLGAPSIGYSSIHDRNNPLAWRPLEWTFLHDKYPRMVAIGVKDRAVRFNGQEARTYGDPCWGWLGTEYCQYGITLSSWILIVQFPNSSHLRILDTGVWSMNDGCGGLTLFIDPLDENLHVAVVTNDKMWHVRVPLTKQRWLHVLAGWSETDGLYVNINKGELVQYTDGFQAVPKIFKGNASDTESKIACENATLRIGNYQEKGYRDGSFEIDDVYIFSESLEQSLMYEITGLNENIPVRHEISKMSILTNGQHLFSSVPENHTEEVSAVHEMVNSDGNHTSVSIQFANTCLGSTIRCYDGFTLGVWINIASETENDIADHLPDTIVTNLGQSGATDITTGFKLYLMTDYLKTSYRIYLTADMNDSAVVPDSGRLSTVERGESYFFMLQMSGQGVWRYCFQLPTDCHVIHTSSNNPRAFKESGIDFHDPNTVFVTGPTVDGQKDLFSVNVSVIEEDLDLLEAYDYFHKISPPKFFPLTGNMLASTDGLTEFQVVGNESLLTMQDFIGISFGDAGNRDLSDVAWLEIPNGELTSVPCLADIDTCVDGFTMQFWLLKHECDKLHSGSSSGVCVHITNMPSVRDFNKGFAVYSMDDSDDVTVVVQTSESRLETYLGWPEDEFVLLRMSWHPIQGLSIFVNDVLELEKSPKANPASDVANSKASLVIGCAPHDNTSCSRMKIHHLYYWDGVVKGKPYADLETFCAGSSIEAGESCMYVVAQASDRKDAKNRCEDSGGGLSSLSTLQQFIAYDLMRHRQGYDINGFWTGLERLSDTAILASKAGISTEEMGYFPMQNYDMSDPKFWFSLHRELFLDVSSTRHHVLCENTVKDISHYGCVEESILDLSRSYIMELKGAGGTNAHGTYSIPKACMRACSMEYGSLTVAVNRGTCICFESDYDLNETPVSLSSEHHCKAHIVDGKMSLAYFDIGTDNRLHRDHCGPIQLAGAMKCGGSWSKDVGLLNSATKYVAVYQRSSISVTSKNRLDEVNFMLVENSTWSAVTMFETYIPFYFAFLSLKCYTSSEYPNNAEIQDPSCTGLIFKVSLDFGDGTIEEINGINYNQGKQLRIPHYYTDPGDYIVYVAVETMPGDSITNTSKTITVTRPLSTVILSHLSLPFGQPEESIPLSVAGLIGESMKCRWNQNNIKSSKKVWYLPIPVVDHKYVEAGYFDVDVSCENDIATSAVTGLAVIDSPIDLLDAVDNVVVDYDVDVYEHDWNVLGGSNIICQVYIGNLSIPEKKSGENYSCDALSPFVRVSCGYHAISSCNAAGCCYDSSSGECYSSIRASSYFSFDAVLRKGTAYFSKNLYRLTGEPFVPVTYIISVMCFNSATDPVPLALTYLVVEGKIEELDVDVFEDKTFFTPNEEMTILVRVKEGRNVQLYWDFDDEPEKNFVEICGHDECATRKYTIKIPRDGVYNISVMAYNALSVLQRYIAIRVEVPVTPVTIHASDVSMAFKPVEITLVMKDDDAPFPTPGVFLLKYSGKEDPDKFPLLFDDDTRSLIVSHRFKEIGIYSIEAYVMNNVSQVRLSTTVQVGKNISGLEIFVASSRYLRTGQDIAILHVIVAEGSEITYRMKFGDESETMDEPYLFKENITRQLSTDVDYNVLSHYYRHPGNYSCIVTAENIFGSTESTIEEVLVVQNPLNGDIVLVPVDVDTVPFPPGNVSLLATLSIAEGSVLTPSAIANGYANQVDMDLLLGREILKRVHAAYEIDLFPLNISLPVAQVGKVEISALLSNLVSSMSYSFYFTMSEIVEHINVIPELAYGDGIVTEYPNGTFLVDIIIGKDLTFYIATDKGSHLRYIILFGDGSPNITVDSLTLFGSERFVEVEHTFRHVGIYDMDVVAQNNVSSETLTLPKAIRAYEEIISVSYSEYYIVGDFEFDVDDINYLGFDEKAATSIYQGNRYLPANKTLVIIAVIMHGSNATFTWSIAEAGIQLEKTENGIKYINSTSDAILKISNGSLDINDISITLAKSPYTESAFESTLIIRWIQPGSHTVELQVSNAVSSVSKILEFDVRDSVADAEFLKTEPPLANYTTNISLAIPQVNSNPCILLNWGDGTTPISFGFDRNFCTGDDRTDDSYFIFIPKKENATIEAFGLTVSFFFDGNANSTQRDLVIIIPHNYVLEGIYLAKLLVFNRVSSFLILQDIAVIEILCDYPKVVIEKDALNSRTKPRKVLKSLALKLYSTTRTRCLISSQTFSTWAVYKENKGVAATDDSDNVEDFLNLVDISDENWYQEEGLRHIKDYVQTQFDTETYHYVNVPGLDYSFKSDILRIPPRFLSLDIHLVCLNVAMVGVNGVSSTDCIYVNVNPTPLVARVLNGNVRTVGPNDLITVTGLGASYDPDYESPDAEQAKNVTLGKRLYYEWSALFLANTSTGDYSNGATTEELDSIFSLQQGPAEISACTNTTIDMTCSGISLINILNVSSFHSTTGEKCQHGDQECPANAVYSQLLLSCNGKSTCDFMVPILTSDLDFGSGSGNGIDNETDIFDHDCVDMWYDCVTPNEYVYFKSHNPCLSGGYYTAEQEAENGMAAVSVRNDADTNQCPSLEVNAKKLKQDQNYIMFVKVTDPSTGRLAVSYQILGIQDGETPALRIECIVNCKARINSFKVLSMKVHCFKCTNSSQISYQWTVYQLDRENKTYSLIENFVNRTTTGDRLPAFVVKSQSLLPGDKYRFTVIGTSDGYLPGMTTKDVTVNMPPKDGHCDINPKSGNCMNQTFTIHCWGWTDEGVNAETAEKDESATLKYEIWYQKHSREAPYLLSSGNNAIIGDKYLAPGIVEEDFWKCSWVLGNVPGTVDFVYRVTIHVHIVDDFGDKASITMRAEVYEDLISDDEGLQNLTDLTITSSGAQATSQFSQMAGEILNAQADKESNSSNDGAGTEDATNRKENRAKLRSELVKAVTQKTSYDNNLEGVQQASSALKSLIGAPDEVGNDTQLDAVNALSDMTTSLSGIARTEAPEDIEEAASNLVGALDLVVDAAREQFVSTAAVEEGVTKYSLPPPSTDSAKAILDEEENYLSPEERLEYRKQKEHDAAILHARNREQAKKVGSSAIGSIGSLSATLMSKKQAGEPSIKLQGKDMKVEVERKTAKTLCENGSGKKGFQLPCDAGLLDGLDDDVTIDVEYVVADKNPFIWDDSADSINSAVVSLNLNLPNSKKINSTKSANPFRIEVPTKKTKYSEPEEHVFDPSGIHEMSYHEVVLRNESDVMFLTVEPEYDAKIRLYFEFADNLTIFPNIENNSLVIDVKEFADNPEYPNRIRLDSDNLGGIGRFVFGIHETDERGNVIHPTNMTWKNYTLHTIVTSCRYWDEEMQRWDTAGCVVSSETSEDVVVCLCDHLTSFGADFFVAPNPIDFSVIAKNIGNLANNLAVLLTLVGIIVLFVVGIIYFRREDKKDVEKWSVSPLLDNQLIHQYFYQVMVKTGKASNAGTRSKVHFVVSGQNFDTTVRTLSSKDDMVFQAGGVVKVIMATEKPLGKLNYIRIWHDNSGEGKWSSWFLDAIMVTDLQTNKKFYFLCDDWLAIDQSDGAIDRVILVAATEEIRSFKNLFQASTSRDFSDGHLWFSMFSRPTKSNFTRVQRLACAVTLLFCTMLASAMFYGREEENSSKQGKLEIGPIKFSVQQLIVSLQSSLIVVPVNILIVQMFRKLAPKKSGKHYISESVKNVLSTVSLHNAIENENEDEKKNKTKKEGFKFPHWCLYIAWILVVVTSLSCAGVVFLYSIMWGPEKSNDWLVSIVLAFVQSVFLIQPGKVIVMAVVFSVVVKWFASSKVDQAVDEMMQAEEDDESNLQQLHIQLESQEEWILRFPDEDLDESSRQNMLPPDPEVLEGARVAMLKRNRMVTTAYEIFSYILYVILLLFASNSSKDTNSFSYHQSLSKVFVDGGDLPFTDVQTIADFWEWSETSLVDGLFAPNWYNGQRVTWSESRFISDRESFVLGPARLRQIRTVDDECIPPGEAIKIVDHCIPTYNFNNEETKDYFPFWVRDYSVNEKEEKTPWIYQNFFELEGFPFEGKLNVYGGGGYAAVLGNTAKSSRSILANLKDHDWIDRYTSAVFVEFTVYNANINLFGIVLLLFERSGNGAFEPLVKIYPLRLFDFIDGQGYILMTVYVIFILVLVYKWYKIVLEIKKLKIQFFKDFWNAVDFLSAILSLILIPLYAIRYIQCKYILGKLNKDPDKENFVNFQFIALWNDSFRFLMAFVVFFAIAKFVRLLRFNTRIQMLTSTLRISAVPLLYFAAMFALYFCSFLFLSWLWFEQKIYAFSTVILAAEEMLVMMLGRFDFTELKTADRMLGPIFFTSFTFCCSIALVNMFVVILDESIKKAKARNEYVANEFELVDFLKKKVKEVIMSKLPTSFLSSRKENYKVKEEETFARKDYIHYPHEVLSRRVDTIAAKVNELEKFWLQDERLPTVEELEAELVDMEMTESFTDIRKF